MSTGQPLRTVTPSPAEHYNAEVFLDREMLSRRDLTHQLVLDPASGDTHSYRVPGFDSSLKNPINTATPMPFPLSALAPPLVPANSLSAPDRPASFESRFADRGQIPADNADDLSSPVLRALRKYNMTASAGLAPASGTLSPVFAA